MKIKKVTPEELEEILDRDTMDEDLEEYEEYKIDIAEPDYMMTVGVPYYIDQYGLLIIEAIYYAEYEDGEMVPDWEPVLFMNGTVERTLPKKMLRTGTIMNREDSSPHYIITYTVNSPPPVEVGLRKKIGI